ncbi:MAG: hypothetical protein KDH20_07765 [Rhodocyclaceae bacterium]|nr:hypothetical protein [Rhodocyclaceae bacterium]
MTLNTRLLAIVAASLPLTAMAQQTVDKKWDTAITGTPQISQDQYAATSMDSAGNLYVAATTKFKNGTFFADIMEARLVKLDKTGATIWDNAFRGDGSLGAEAIDSEYDPRGAVYLVAMDAVGSNDSRSTLIKYDIDGQLHWTAVRTDFSPARLSVAPDGSVYMIGKLYTSDTCMVIKYGADGVQEWQWSLPGLKAPDGQPGGIAATQDSGVAVSCGTRLSDGITGIEVARLDANGAVVWADRHAEGSAHTLRLDDDGGVTVGGTYKSDFSIAKWNPAGIKLWGGRYGDPTLFDDLHDLAVDQNGDVIATGIMNGTSGYLFADAGTVKLSGVDGSSIWQNTYRSGMFNAGESIAIDASGNVLVLAEYQQGQMLIKYDAFGAQSWLHMPPQGEVQLVANLINPATLLPTPLGCYIVAGLGSGAGTGTGVDAVVLKYCLGPELCN